jgi:excisionase family DNA binding protein
MEEVRFLSAPALAEQFGLGDRKSVYYLVDTQGLPCYRVGERRLLFDPDEVDRWIRERAERRVVTGRLAPPL